MRSLQEYAALRQTIAQRGTLRIALLPGTLLGWGLLAALVIAGAESARAGVLSLGVLIGGFEAIHALHFGVERIGRYLQVFYEETGEGDPTDRPRWETTAMAAGPALPGGGIDPLFTPVFVAAVIVNGLFVVPAEPFLERLIVIATHIFVIVRMLRLRRAAGSQRAVDLAHYRAVRDRNPPP